MYSQYKGVVVDSYYLTVIANLIHKSLAKQRNYSLYYTKIYIAARAAGVKMKAIVSVIGKDKPGIIAKVSGALYNLGINIEDISQTIMQDKYFTMIMMIGLKDSDSIEAVNAHLQTIAADADVEINVRHEDIFNNMHRI